MTSNNVTTEPVLIEPITVDLKPIIEHGQSPTAIILAITIFTAVLLNSLTKLFYGFAFILKKGHVSKKHEG
jgi:hypothetical protein